MTSNILKLEQGFCTEYGIFEEHDTVDWDATELENLTSIAEKAFRLDNQIRKVAFNIENGVDIEGCCVQYIEFHRLVGAVLYLQNKWCASDCAEYLIP